uniref:Uncharacterized protein n=1 Tax=Glossina austeni TaxID=7395 RepID=A0A1A9VWN6_GLOAU
MPGEQQHINNNNNKKNTTTIGFIANRSTTLLWYTVNIQRSLLYENYVYCLLDIDRQDDNHHHHHLYNNDVYNEKNAILAPFTRIFKKEAQKANALLCRTTLCLKLFNEIKVRPRLDRKPTYITSPCEELKGKHQCFPSKGVGSNRDHMIYDLKGD